MSVQDWKPGFSAGIKAPRRDHRQFTPGAFIAIFAIDVQEFFDARLLCLSGESSRAHTPQSSGQCVNYARELLPADSRNIREPAIVRSNFQILQGVDIKVSM